MRVSYQQLHSELIRVLLKIGFTPERADLCARLFADTDRDGVYTNGLNRFLRFMAMIASGVVDIDAQPKLESGAGALERWDGVRGPGNLNAYASMQRAITLAGENGIGCVALANTNHWMRGGTYGWQAADAGMIGICWTNTLPNLPPWGAREPRLGNNPLVIAVPRSDGHVVLDMSMSQFSYGTLEAYQKRGELLPVFGGFNQDGELTRDPVAIEATGRPLPIGFWKGSGLSLLLDMMAALLSGGSATHEINANSYQETGLSQTFICFNVNAFRDSAARELLTNQIIANMKGAAPSGGGEIRYPGERTLATRKENMELGIPVEPSVWSELQKMWCIDFERSLHIS